MTVLKFELEVDSVAHPELYELVAAIANPAFREERMRQLASTGMIWERLRQSPELGPYGAARLEGAAAATHLALVTSTRASKPDALGLPVLRDEVPAHAVPRPSDEVPGPLPDGVPTLAPSSPVPSADPPARTPAPVAAEAAVDTAPAVHMSGKRSRLMRMKSRGLFTNE